MEEVWQAGHQRPLGAALRQDGASPVTLRESPSLGRTSEFGVMPPPRTLSRRVIPEVLVGSSGAQELEESGACMV